MGMLVVLREGDGAEESRCRGNVLMCAAFMLHFGGCDFGGDFEWVIHVLPD